MINIKKIVLGNLGNNCYLLTDEKSGKSALIDCESSDDRMMDFIADSNLEYILLTHGHFDHISGVKGVKEKYGAKVVISREDEGMLHSGKLSLALFCGYKQNCVDADILVSDGDIIELGQTTIKVLATPGHTKGGVCYIINDENENVIFSGDTLFKTSCGRTDFPGGSVVEMKESLMKLRNLEGDYKVYPGHNAETTLQFERQNNSYMR